MNDDQAYRIRIIQYLLSKEDFIKEDILEQQKYLRRKDLSPDDLFELWLSLIKLECWQNFAGDIWKLIK